MKSLLLILFFVYFMHLSVHGEKPTSRIVGGQVARVGQFKFAAAVYVHTAEGRFFCGGALTGTQWIITSGHCVQNAVLFTVQLGSNTLTGDDPNRETVATSKYYLHPDFNPETLDNDIGIIEFREPIYLNGYIQPIYMSSMNHVNYTDTVTLGFGQISDSDPELSNELRYVEIVAVTHAECQTIYGNQVTENMICAIGNYNEGTCIGDMGGPLFITNGKYSSIIGVASFISGNGCESTEPSGFTRTFPYRDWINNITRRF